VKGECKGETMRQQLNPASRRARTKILLIAEGTGEGRGRNHRKGGDSHCAKDLEAFWPGGEDLTANMTVKEWAGHSPEANTGEKVRVPFGTIKFRPAKREREKGGVPSASVS